MRLPQVVHESPTVALDALPFREPWVSVHPGVIRPRNRTLSEAEQGFLDPLQDADARLAQEALAWCATEGHPAECG